MAQVTSPAEVPSTEPLPPREYPALRCSISRAWYPVAVLVGVRLVMWAAIFLFSHLFHRYVTNPWDGGWYVLAAQHGWPHHVKTGFGNAAQDTLAFFPGFPAIIRAVHFVLPISWMHAGEVAAFLTEVAMVIGVWLLAGELWGRSAADRAVVVLCLFPGSFILAMMYSEPLLIAAAAFCFLALRRRQWVLAGVLASIGTTARITGLALVVCCAWEAVTAIRKDREWSALWAPVLAPLGVIAWFLYLWASTGAKLAWFDTEKYGWAQHTTLMAVPDLVRSVLHTHPADPNQFLPLASTAVAVILLAVLLVSRPPAMLSIYSVVVVVLSATATNPSGVRFRFVLAAFPLVIVVARYLKDAAFALAVSLGTLIMGIMLVITLM
ncbi:MAG TPA: hypothetical protein VG435_03550, partial [Acidimicrobiales bacterium]|nr:hypothetical protein [Acidimicrobiales bacterium]